MTEMMDKQQNEQEEIEQYPPTEIPEGYSQTDLVKDLNFDIDPEDPLTKASLKDHTEGEWIDILGNGQLRKKTISKGKSSFRPNRYDLCTLSILGRLENRMIVEEHMNITIQLGDVEVVQGLDLAIALMEVGETAEIHVASRFAYGDVGLQPNVPAGATIIYTVELKSVEIAPEIEELEFEQRKKTGNEKRERGNWWFWRDEPTIAIQCYRRALEFLNPASAVSSSGSRGAGSGTPGETNEAEESVSNSDLQALLECRTKVYNNLAAAQMKVEAYDAALESVENVLRSQPQNIKALFRKGKILHKKGLHAEAHATLVYASKLDPESRAIIQELAILKEKTARDTLHEKNLYRKMLGTPKEVRTSEKTRKTEGEGGEKDRSKNSTTKVATWTLFGGAVAAAAAVIAYRFVF